MVFQQLPKVTFPIGPNFPKTRPVHQMILNPWWQSTTAAAVCVDVVELPNQANMRI